MAGSTLPPEHTTATHLPRERHPAGQHRRQGRGAAGFDDDVEGRETQPIAAITSASLTATPRAFGARRMAKVIRPGVGAISASQKLAVPAVV